MSRPQKTIRRPAGLAAAGLVTASDLPAMERVAAQYALAITPEMAGLIDPTNARDPIARQFIPDARELTQTPEENADPIGDDAHSPLDGIVHRYPDRVLLKPLHACAVYCRFCFRREMVGPGGLRPLSPDALEAALAYIRARPEIWEVIVTGGDPLILSPRRLRAITTALGAIAHVRVVRFHTRVPAVDPALVTAPLIRALKASGRATYVALHANHSREFTEAARAAIARVVDAGIPMLGQTVLLRGINDEPEVLGALLRTFVENRIKPYYLHHGDLAPGTSQFRTTIAEGQALARRIQGRLSGLCQPAYVLDIPGGHGKSPIGPSYVGGSNNDRVQDYRGTWHSYPPADENSP